MSTRDSQTPSGASGQAPDAGVNAYKVKRGGLAAPPASAPVPPPATPAAPTGPSVPPAAAGRRRPRAAAWMGLGLLLAAVALGIVLHNRRAPRPAFSRAAARPAESATSSGALQPTHATLPDYRALVIGINQYAPAGGEGWQPLRSARADAEAMAAILADEFGFDVRLLLDREATRASILNALDELATTGADGADLIYFAGHGYYDDKLNEGYWIPADARRTTDGRDAKEDWLWNSTITRLIGASQARHVLVMSDACYSGALFRGDEPLRPPSGQAWYARAIVKPSRYLITSGGLEPVLDSGGGHSVFAQQTLNYLRHAGQDMFSANDLGSALRERVAALTGQMVQMGPLPLGGHFGGEFVFIRRKAHGLFAALAPAAPADGALLRGPEAPTDEKVRGETLRQAVELLQAGAPQAAGSLVAGLLHENGEDRLARTVAEAIARSQRREAQDDLQRLIDQLAAKGKPTDAAPAERPRVLACLGPVWPDVGSPAGEGAARLYRIVLRAELEAHGGLKIIEREALASILREQSLGASDLADPQARLAIGRLLPASVILLGDLIAAGDAETLYLRLVDTETTQVIATLSATRQPDEELQPFCAALAARIAERIGAPKKGE